MKKIIIGTFFSFLVMGIAIATIFLSGFFVAENKSWPYPEIKKYAQKTEAYFKDFAAVNSDVRRIATVFFWLKLQDIAVPFKREGSGGGMTSMGDELVLLTYEGKIFRVDNKGAVATDIETPDNGYMQSIIDTRAKEYANYKLDLGTLRFNDILYFSSNDAAYLAISYTEWHTQGQCFTSAVATLRIDPNTSSIMDISARKTDWKIVFRSTPCLPLKNTEFAIEGHMGGGRLASIGDGKILITIGDYFRDGINAPFSLARDMNADYGKVIEIDIEQQTHRIISMGHRNPQGIAVDRAGNIWVVEHGMRGGDELNLIKEGADYGWPEETLGTTYEHTPWPLAKYYGRHDIHTGPIYAWVPSVAISNLTVINNFHASWDGDLLASSLRMQTLYRLRISDSRVVFSEPINIGTRIRYAHQHVSGQIALWTDDHRVIFLSPASTDSYADAIGVALRDLPYPKETVGRIEATFTACRECHSLGADDDQGAPSLGGIYGRKIAGSRFPGYSEALGAVEGTWTTERLTEYILDPQAVAPGSSMPSPGISDRDVAEGVVRLLKAL